MKAAVSAGSNGYNAFLGLFKHITYKNSLSIPPVLRNTPRITKPIVSAPMNGWAGPKLVSAVANHGGLPIYAIGYFTNPDAIVKDLLTIPSTIAHDDHSKEEESAVAAAPVQQQQQGRPHQRYMPYAVGFVTFWLDRQGPELLLRILRGEGDPKFSKGAALEEVRPPAAIWLSFGNYRPYLDLIRHHGAPETRVIVQVQTLEEAIEAQKNKVDVIVLQGTESGGHGAQRVVPLFTFLPEAVQALKDNAEASGGQLPIPPLLAAGGISTGKQFLTTTILGASGVVIGTGFMPTVESAGPQHAKERLLKIQDGGVSTVRTRIFDELREFDYPIGFDGRVVRNLVTEREEEDQRKLGLYEQTGEDSFKLLKEDRSGTKADWVRATQEQDFDLLPLWSGTGVGMLTKQGTAAEFMDQLLDPNGRP
ncbi:nitronate monooxygenase [Entomortierella parvispora]|uniref:Nitronate monooxygenase n=1 Tax=Entomortierella parvispora TaxID=205924 RepID=A0A9P3LT23_9FUNG|nr:nitronate monooxygenase [Entomortierella parvispora]